MTDGPGAEEDINTRLLMEAIASFVESGQSVYDLRRIIEESASGDVEFIREVRLERRRIEVREAATRAHAEALAGSSVTEWIDVPTLARSDAPPHVIPTVLSRVDGKSLLYRGALNGIYGPGGVGKTMVAALAVTQALAARQHVIIVDVGEMGADRWMTLLLDDLSLEPDLIAEYFHLKYLETPLNAHEVRDVKTAAWDLRAPCIVIDSVGNGLVLEDKDENSATDYGAWVMRLKPLIAEYPEGPGPAVLLIDHDTGAGKLSGPAGSYRKKAAYTGALYRVGTELSDFKPFSREEAGGFSVVTVKDRLGNFTVGKPAGRFEVVPAGGLVAVPTKPVTDEEFAAAMAAVMERVGKPMKISLTVPVPAGGSSGTGGVVDPKIAHSVLMALWKSPRRTMPTVADIAKAVGKRKSDVSAALRILETLEFVDSVHGGGYSAVSRVSLKDLEKLMREFRDGFPEGTSRDPEWEPHVVPEPVPESE